MVASLKDGPQWPPPPGIHTLCSPLLQNMAQVLLHHCWDQAMEVFEAPVLVTLLDHPLALGDTSAPLWVVLWRSACGEDLRPPASCPMSETGAAPLAQSGLQMAAPSWETWAQTTRLRHSQIPDSQKLQEITDTCCFRPELWDKICYITIDTDTITHVSLVSRIHMLEYPGSVII